MSTRSRLLGLARVLVAAAALMGGATDAATITYLEDLRVIHANSFIRVGSDLPVSESETLQPSPLFSDFSDGIVFGAGAALQTSLLRDTWIYAQGFARGELDINFSGNAFSVFHVTFSVDEATSWSLEGVLGRASNFSAENLAEAQVILSSGGSALFALALAPGSIEDNEPVSVPISAAGELMPGEYELLVEATSSLAGTSTPGIANFQLWFRVPEPNITGMLLAGFVLGVGATGSGSGARSRRRRRGTHGSR